jgi:hypothetical protein
MEKDQKMRSLMLILAMILLSAADIATTWYLLSRNLAVELNPFANTESISTLIFSPVPRFLNFIFLMSVLLAEKYADRFDAIVEKSYLRALIFLFPLYSILVIVLAVASNSALILGLPSPLPVYIRSFDFLSDNPSVQISTAFSCLWLVSFPVLLKVARAMYANTT